MKIIEQILAFILAILVILMIPVILFVGSMLYPFVMAWEKFDDNN